MQEKYISLDPANADSQSAKLRASLWLQRRREAKGGDLAIQTGLQFGFTFMAVYFASLKSKGFSVIPFAAKKSPQYSAILLWGVLGYNLGALYVQSKLGDRDTRHYLEENRSAILNGQRPMN